MFLYYYADFLDHLRFNNDSNITLIFQSFYMNIGALVSWQKVTKITSSCVILRKIELFMCIIYVHTYAQTLYMCNLSALNSLGIKYYLIILYNTVDRKTDIRALPIGVLKWWSKHRTVETYNIHSTESLIRSISQS